MKSFFRSRFLAAMAGLAFVGISGCGGETQTPTIVQNQSVHQDLGRALKVSFANLVKESKTPNAKALFKGVSNFQKMLGPNMSTSLPAELDVEIVTRIVQDMLESDVVKDIFSQSNIVAQTDNETTYEVKSSVCSKLVELMASNDTTMPDRCAQFLQDHVLHLKVQMLENNAMTLEIWHALRTDAQNMQRVVSFSVSPNSLGLTINLDEAQKFVDSIMTFGNKASGLSELGIKKLKGEATLRLQFKSDDAASGCMNDESFCFVLNVDRDLDVELDLAKPLALKVGASDKSDPSLVLSSNSDALLVAAANLAPIEISYGVDNAFLEAMRFSLSLPLDFEQAGFQLHIDNFSTGPRASQITAFGKKFVLDFASQTRVVDSIDFAMGDFVMLNLSPLDLLVSMVDETDETCLITESVQLTTQSFENTRLKFSMPGLSLPGSSKTSRFNDNKAGYCNESNLFLFGMWSIFGVSSVDCEQTSLLNVEEGNLKLTYRYMLNNSMSEPSVLEAAMGQCISM